MSTMITNVDYTGNTCDRTSTADFLIQGKGTLCMNKKSSTFIY